MPRPAVMDGDSDFDDRSSIESRRSSASSGPPVTASNRITRDRIYALLAVCTMSIGSHL
jgi:hypothetical protein